MGSAMQWNNQPKRLPISLFALWILAVGLANPAFADLAILVDQGVLVETTPETEPLDEGEIPAPETEVGVANNATYVSDGGFAVTGPDFIDVATFVFDFSTTASVSGATLILQLQELFPQNDAAPLEVSFFSDNGVIEVTDYAIGFPSSIENFDATTISGTEIRIDVTGPVNASLNASQFVGFRIGSTVEPGSVDTSLLLSLIHI